MKRAGGLLGLFLTLALGAVGTWLYRDDPQLPVLGTLVWALTLSSSAAGLVVLWLRPAQRVGVLLVVQGPVLALVMWQGAYVDAGLDRGWPGLGWVQQWNASSWPLLFVFLAWLGYVFPTGQPLSRRWARFQRVTSLAFPLFVVGGLFDGEAFAPKYSSLHHPLPTVPGLQLVELLIGLPLLLAHLVGASLATRARFRRATGVERLQLLWFAWAALLIPSGFVLCLVDNTRDGSTEELTVVGIAVSGTLLPVCIAVALVRHGLFDIERAVARTLLYGVLAGLVAGLYAAGVYGFGAIVGSGVGGFVAVVVVAVGAEPLRSRLHRRVEHWVYGARRDPYLTLSSLGDRLAMTLAPHDVLSTVCGTVHEALDLSYTAISLRSLDGLRLVTSAGVATGDNRRDLILVHHGQTMGTLTVEGVLLDRDERLLRDLSRQAGAAVHAVRLTLDLQHSRERLVSAQEEERRRLRRDLHDGLGPELAAIVMRLDGARRLPAVEVTPVLDELLVQVRAAVTEIRRLVDGLRPPALDEVGLVGALRQQAFRLSQGTVRIEVEGPAGQLRLSAAVEVAAYRIGVEAMTNAVRHSGAARCQVLVDLNGHLSLTVQDDGVGMRENPTGGVGLASMSERAAELGGTLDVSPRIEGGTAVLAVLPT